MSGTAWKLDEDALLKEGLDWVATVAQQATQVGKSNSQQVFQRFT